MLVIPFWATTETSDGVVFDTVVVADWSKDTKVITVYDPSSKDSAELGYIRGDVKNLVGEKVVVYTSTDSKSVVLVSVQQTDKSMVQALPAAISAIGNHSLSSMQKSGVTCVQNGRFLNLSIRGNGVCAMKLYSISGRNVGTFNVKAGSARVDLGSFGIGKGLYVLRIRSAGINQAFPINLN